MKQSQVSVVICTLDRIESLFQTLNSIFRQTLPQESIEIVVVDNCGSDQLKAALGQLKHGPTVVKYVCEKRKGVSNARNTGIRFASGKFVAFIDDDAEADCRWLEKLIQSFSEPPYPDAVTGPIFPPNSFKLPDWFPPRLRTHLCLLYSGNKPKLMKYPHYGFGTNMAFRRTIFEKVGNFDPKLGRSGPGSFFAGEETDIFLRIERSTGVIVYSPEAYVVHEVQPERLSIEWLFNQTFWIGFSSSSIERKSLSRSYIISMGILATMAILTSAFTAIGSIFIGSKAFKVLLRCIALNRMGYLMGHRSLYPQADLYLRRFYPLMCLGLPPALGH
jgi:glycosyltransferase involved in cell wall biosynthesis